MVMEEYEKMGKELMDMRQLLNDVPMANFLQMTSFKEKVVEALEKWQGKAGELGKLC